MASERKTGLGALPAGLLRPTTQPEPTPEPAPVADEGQGGDAAPAREDAAAEARAPKVRRKRTPAAAAEKLEGRRLYLSEGVHFRLRLYAYQRKQKLSEAAEDLLDKALPKYNVDRVN